MNHQPSHQGIFGVTFFFWGKGEWLEVSNLRQKAMDEANLRTVILRDLVAELGLLRDKKKAVQIQDTLEQDMDWQRKLK